MIVSQKLARPATWGVSAEAPLFLYRRIHMPQAFLDYNGQIDKLDKEKDLIIQDRVYATEMLTRYGYFSLIGGYKNIFINKSVGKYKRGTTFEDIVSLYVFDEELRSLFLKYILKFERKLHSVISYHFTQTYGEQQRYYLDKNNFNYIPQYSIGIDELTRRLNNLATRPTDYAYINYHRNKYNNVPLWVLINAVTLGSISRFYMYSKPALQSKISKDFPNLNEKQLEQILSVITKFRNVCAHGERLFTYKTKDSIGDLILHQKLKIPTRRNKYQCGKNDLFAVVISLRYVLSNDDFIVFKRQLAYLIKRLIADTSLSENDILSAMGFPSNWNKITSFKKLS